MTRFHASRRLARHKKYSTYIVVTISMSIILISLMQTYDIGKKIDTDYASVIQIFSAIAVLVYSLLIDKNNYSATSEKMFACASKISKLQQRMHPYLKLETTKEEQYQNFRKEYWEILDLYETHVNNDFIGDNIRARLDLKDYYQFSRTERILKRTQVAWLYARNFLSYFIVLSTLFFVLKWLWLG